MEPRLKLHGFFNSSASYRVRIALELKGLAWQHVGVDIRSGEQETQQFKQINPNGLLPGATGRLRAAHAFRHGAVPTHPAGACVLPGATAIPARRPRCSTSSHAGMTTASFMKDWAPSGRRSADAGDAGLNGTLATGD